MTTILRFLLFFLLAPVFAVIVQAAGSWQEDLRVVDAGVHSGSIIQDGLSSSQCAYDSSGALLQQRRIIDPSEVAQIDLDFGAGIISEITAEFTPVGMALAGKDFIAEPGFLTGATILPGVPRLGPIKRLSAARTTTGQQSTALSTFRQTQPGETFYHYGYTQHAAGFQSGLRPGGFATTNSGLTGSAAQRGLALPHATPPNAMYIIRPAPGTQIQWGPVGPQTSQGILYPGGGTQIQILVPPAQRANVLTPVGPARPIQ